MWKGCIFMMMMANLCATEMYHFLIDGSKASKVRCADQDGSLKASVPRKSSTVIALRFQNTQQVYIQDKLGPGFGEVCSSDSLQRCTSSYGRDNVRTILKGLTGRGEDSSDLYDFIECNPSLDYSNWWTQRKKFKKFKDHKWIRSKRHSMSRLRTSKVWLR